MKLNPDCVRAILLAVEGVCDMGHYFDFPDDAHHIKGKFTSDEIVYHVRQCDLSGMLYKCVVSSAGFSIIDLSPKGHEFLANVRKDNVWSDIKAISGKIGATSLSAITQIAAAVIAEIIKSQLGLHPTQAP